MFKLLSYVTNALVLATALAGIKKSTGYTIKTEIIQPEILKQAVDVYLKAGEYVIQKSLLVISWYPQFFKKE